MPIKPIQTTPEPDPNYVPVEVFTHLRNLVFQTPPETLGLVRSEEYPLVWGAVMELGYVEAVATLISFADGTTSLVFSNGGGMIGGGQHNAVAEASRAFVTSAELYVEQMDPAEFAPLPAPGRVRFYILTFEGIFTTDADVVELEKEIHPLSSLYFSGQDVIAQLRLIQEQKS